MLFSNFAPLKDKSKIAFHTLGCKLNFSETSALKKEVADQFTIVENAFESDYFVLNTCSVTQNADKESRQIIRRIKKKNPQAKVLVTGCYAQLKPEEIARMEGVDRVLGANDKFRLTQHLKELDTGYNDEHVIYGCEIENIADFYSSYSGEDRTRCFLKVQDGCDYTCSFCTIPLARGKSRSDTINNVLRNIEEIAGTGVMEIILTGINLGDFGKGASGNRKTEENFYDLIQAIEKQNAIPRFRISSIEPNLLTHEIISFIASSRIFQPHFHIPLQSGSDYILGKMKRRYQSELYAERVSFIRNMIPDACIGVDVIVGFPGEKDEYFNDTVEFLKSLDIQYLHVFTYSERTNTFAMNMDEVIPKEVRMKRNAILRKLSDEKMTLFRAKYKNTRRPVLFEKEDKKGQMEGYSDNYIRISRPFDPGKINTISWENID